MNAVVTKEKVPEGQGSSYPGALSICNTNIHSHHSFVVLPFGWYSLQHVELSFTIGNCFARKSNLIAHLPKSIDIHIN